MKPLSIIRSLFFLLLSASVFAVFADTKWQPNQGLQLDLQSVIKQLGLEKQTKAKRLAIGIIDMTEPDAVRFAAVNPHKMLYAASLPKIAILFAAGILIERGKLVADAALVEDMHRMIRNSDNASATRVLEKVGRDRLTQIMAEPSIRLYDPDLKGGLWVGKPYSKERAYKRDPVYGISHGATVYQVLRFYYLLEYGELFSDETRMLLKSALIDPAIEHKFVAGLKHHDFEALYRKSGTWKTYHSDAVFVDTGEYRFVITALSNHPEGGRWLEQLAPKLYDIIVD